MDLPQLLQKTKIRIFIPRKRSVFFPSFYFLYLKKIIWIILSTNSLFYGWVSNIFLYWNRARSCSIFFSCYLFFFFIKQKDFIETKQQKTKQRLAQPFFFNCNSKTKRTATPIKRTKKITSKRPLPNLASLQILVLYLARNSIQSLKRMLGFESMY